MRNKKWWVSLILFCFMCFMCAGCSPVAQAKNKTTGDESSERVEQAYQEFLNGERRVYIEKEIQELIQMEFSDAETSGVFLQDIMKQVCGNYGHEVFQDKMETVQYAYLDCFDDGKKELAVAFCGLVPIDDENWTAIIVYEDGRLYLRHAFLGWVRSQENLYYYGYIEHDGSGGAATHYTGKTLLDRTGRACVIYDAVSEYMYEKKICKEVFNIDELLVCEETYTICEKAYCCLSAAEDEIELSEWEEYCSLYEQEYGELYTQEEIEALLLKRQKDIGAQEKWLGKKELEWDLLENGIYREYVKEIDLLETRKEQREKSKSVLKDKWVFCEPGQYSDQKNYENTGSFHISLDWRYAIKAIIEDYGSKVNIPRGKWTMTDFVSYNSDKSGIYAVTVRFEEPKRELCLLVNSDAIAMNMEEYAAYIVAVDFQFDGQGAVQWGTALSYNSMLDWTSFAHQARADVDEIYTICESENQLYDFEWRGNYAMNQYLKDKGANPSKNWEIDVNAVCSIGGGRMEVVRYFCDGEEIVMVLDEQNRKFAIVKGLDEE